MPCAVILKHLWYWVEKNKANKKHFRDGTYWTYNSIKAFCDIFPYMSKNTIIRALQKLVDEGLIIEATYNDAAFDRTKWYAVTEKGYLLLQTGFTQNEQCHLPKMGNSDLPKMGEPIPNEYHISNHINNISNTNVLDSPSESEEGLSNANQDIVISSWNALTDYGIPPVKKLVSTTNRSKMLKARIREYGIDDVLKAIENIRRSDFLRGKNNRGWMITFDWFVKPNNFPKVLEGKYNDKQQEQVQTPKSDWQ